MSNLNVLQQQKSTQVELKHHAKFQNPKITPSGRKVTQEREERKKKERKKTPLIVDT